MTFQSNIFTMANVEQAPTDTKFYFNMGDQNAIAKLQDELAKCGVDTTVLCNIPSDGRNNCYYTPKNARMANTPGAPTWIDESEIVN